jgi:anti-sigma-K factor RskA
LTEDHGSIEELLAGYVLRSLSGEDAASADHLLSDHVPFCPSCRDSLAVFQGVTADLALGVEPVSPPDTLLPRLHRELGSQRARRRPMTVFAVAASVVAVVGLAGLTVSQGMRASSTQSRMNDIAQAFDFARQPGADMAPVNGATSGTEPLTEISDPGVEVFYLVGRDLPEPGEDMVYRVWLVSGTTPTFAGDFLPSAGFTVVPLEFDPSRYDQIVISVEPAGSSPGEPSNAVWQTTG